MKVLVVGGRGLIGAAVARGLEVHGHTVVIAGRSVTGEGELPLDYTQMPGQEQLAQRLAGVDVVINAVGIFEETAKQSFDSVHVKGPCRLFAAAVDAGVRRGVHISALGADPSSRFAYLSSKGRADEFLAGLPMDLSILRPSLVFAECGQSTRFFARLAALPVTPLPEQGSQLIQPIVLDDLVEAVISLVERGCPPATYNAVGQGALTFKGYLSLFKRGFGRRPRFIPVPARVLGLMLQLAEQWPGARLSTRAAWGMLNAGNVANPRPVAQLLGRDPCAPEDYVPPAAARLRTPATLPWLCALLRVSLAVMWIGSAWASVLGYPLAASLGMLAQVGLGGIPAYVALYAGAVLDLLLGLAMLGAWRPRGLYLVQIGLIAAYTLIISVWLPEHWLHPFAPVLKNIPIVAAIVALYYLDER